MGETTASTQEVRSPEARYREILDNVIGWLDKEKITRSPKPLFYITSSGKRIEVSRTWGGPNLGNFVDVRYHDKGDRQRWALKDTGGVHDTLGYTRHMDDPHDRISSLREDGSYFVINNKVQERRAPLPSEVEIVNVFDKWDDLLKDLKTAQRQTFKRQTLLDRLKVAVKR